jgi:Heavy metal associated domain 2
MIRGARVVHHIPGRLRVRLPRAQRNPRLLEELAKFCESLGGVRQVEINPTTGSLLVHYTPESHDQIRSLLRSQAEGIEQPPELGMADDLADKMEREADFLAAHSEVALRLVNTVKALNREVRIATDNTVDLKVLLPAALAVWAFLKHGIEASTPLWVTLTIFSFNSFVALHHPTTVHVSTHTTQVEPAG